jgi:two-component system, OmpR family, sensor kinase
VSLRSPWRRLRLRTLRGKLIAGLVALLALGCATVSVTAYLATRSSVTSSLDAQLQLDATGWMNCMTGARHDQPADGDDQNGPGGSPPDSRVCPGLGDGTFGARLHDGVFTSVGIIRDTMGSVKTGSVTLTSADRATLKALRPTPQMPDDGPLPVVTRNLTSANLDGDFRLVAVSGDDHDILITGVPMAAMQQTLGTLATTCLIVFVIAVALAGVLGTLWVRLSLRPLERVAATAAEVASLPLETGDVELPSGVPDTDPGTEAGRVGLSFNRMLGHVQAALGRRAASEARLRRFAADASHELRTPLSAIRGYAELALRHTGPVPDEVTHALRRVEAESARMSVLVDDLLLLARLDAGRPLASEPVDLSRLAIDATSDAQVARPSHRWVLDLPDDPVQVIGDNLRLHQVLANLLSNAGRHSPAGSTITVRLRVGSSLVTPANDEGYVRRGDPPDGPLAELSVTDDGPGIAPDLLPDLFERFTRADTARTHADGSSTGLGLAIVDAVVAAHKGCITLTSRPGMTRFAITLSATSSPTPGPATPTGPRRPARPPRRGRGRGRGHQTPDISGFIDPQKLTRRILVPLTTRILRVNRGRAGRGRGRVTRWLGGLGRSGACGRGWCRSRPGLRNGPGGRRPRRRSGSSRPGRRTRHGNRG